MPLWQYVDLATTTKRRVHSLEDACFPILFSRHDPTRLYFRNGRLKCEIAIAKGKQDWDKRETERRREADREARTAINANKHRMGR